MMKRILCLLLSMAMLLSAALAEGWLVFPGQSGSVEDVTEKTVYDAADAAGRVVNASDPGDPSAMDMITYSYTPVEVVLIVDVSGSMSATDDATGKSLLSYAKDAATAFSNTLYTINPASRVGLVWYGSDAGVACDLTGFADQSSLLSAINRLSETGSTNTGGGYEQAVSLMSSSDMPDRRKVFLMLTDGQANMGGSDPEAYAIAQGRRASAMGSVYTIGMVGSLSSDAKRATRRVLEAGYETRYFEVDFDQVANTGIGLTTVMHMIAGSASMAERIDPLTGLAKEASFYHIRSGAGYQVRVQHKNGEYLSNDANDYRASASFGTMSDIGGQYTFVVSDDDLSISVKGVSTQSGGLSVTKMQGLSMKETLVMKQNEYSSPCVNQTLVIEDGNVVSRSDQTYNCLNMFEVDRDGNPIRGLSMPADATTKGNVSVKPAPKSTAQNVSQVAKGGHVSVLAQDLDTGWYYISFTDKEGKLSRGWVEENVLADLRGHVHVMVWLEGNHTISQNTQSMRAPSASAAKAYEIKKGTQVTLRHVERDTQGNEWAYVALPGNPTRCAYVQTNAIEGWQAIAPEGYMLGYDSPVPTTELDFPKIDVQRNQLLKVYSGPATSSWRGAKGKAEVSTNGGLYAMGWVNNEWLLAQYGTSAGNRRVGYIHASAIKGELPVLPQVVFNPVQATVQWECVLTDDPRNASEEIATLRAGTKVTWLASYDNGQLWDYIETKVSGKVVRAFIPQGCLDK